MGMEKGVVGIVFFVFFIVGSFAISFGLGNDAAASGYDIEIAIVFLVEFLLFSSTGLLVPGIFCLLEKKYDKVKWLYSLIPITLIWIEIYTMIVALSSPTSFMSSFLEYLGIGIGASVVLAHITVGLAFLKFY